MYCQAGSLIELGITTTYLIGKGAGTEITKRKLESAVATLDVDLEGDQSVGISRWSRRHDYSFEAEVEVSTER
jgi:hypothetical protein